MNKKTVSFIIAFLLLSTSFFFGAKADSLCRDITKECNITVNGDSASSKLFDGSYRTSTGKSGDILKIVSNEKIGFIYIKFATVPSAYEVKTDGVYSLAGKLGFLHEVLVINGNSVEITLPSSVCSVEVFTEGVLPDEVQRWEAPLDSGADILVFATHFDDDTLFFGGLIAKYADEGKKIQVLHMVNHNDTKDRPHEVLDGVWTMGVKYYPVASEFADKFCKNLAAAEKFYDEEAIMKYLVKHIRRFKPTVVIAHDLNGEYGHGAHCLNALLATECAELSGTISYEPVTAAAYGIHTPQKIYLHLYEGEQGGVLLNTREKLSSGKTPFEIADEAFNKHISQRDYFTVSESGVYDIRKFGLYFSTVGNDSGKNDIFENIP